jgi:corrinoid protein of di/trimethylamine methyltransferase
LKKSFLQRSRFAFTNIRTKYTDEIANLSRKELSFMSIIKDISEAMQAGKSKLVKQLVPQALEEGIPAQMILEEALLAGMDIVGRKFRANEVFVPEVLVAARAMNAGTELLKPYLAEAGMESKGKIVLGTVKGDLHDIGKNLVRMMLEGKGLEVIDLGVDVDPEAFIKTAIEHNCKIIACSALLTTTMPEMGNVVEAAKSAGIRDQVKIMVGGAPVTQSFCDSVGADAYTPDAATAASRALELLATFA